MDRQVPLATLAEALTSATPPVVEVGANEQMRKKLANRKVAIEGAMESVTLESECATSPVVEVGANEQMRKKLANRKAAIEGTTESVTVESDCAANYVLVDDNHTTITSNEQVDRKRLDDIGTACENEVVPVSSHTTTSNDQVYSKKMNDIGTARENEVVPVSSDHAELVDDAGSYSGDDVEGETWVDSAAVDLNCDTRIGDLLGSSLPTCGDRDACKFESTCSIVSTESTRRGVGTLQVELEETIVARETLDAEIRALRAELRAREEKRDALIEKEVELRQKVAHRSLSKSVEKPPPSLEDFLEGRVVIPRPSMFEMKDDEEDDAIEGTMSPQIENFSLDDDDVEVEGESSADWENHLDALGVGKCRLCGLRFPLDVEAIEKHSKECSAGVKGPQFGKCHTCGELLPLNTDEIERHLTICEKRRCMGSAASFTGTASLQAPSESLPCAATSFNGPAQSNGLTAAVRRPNLWTTIFRGNKSAQNDIPSGSRV